MEKTPCYGKCPVYTIRIDKSGKGRFEGVENTDFVGLYSFRLSKEELNELKQSFLNINFYSLKDRYHEYVMDLPTTYISFHHEGKSKKIMDYYGAPEELKSLEKKLANLVLGKKMKKTR